MPRRPTWMKPPVGTPLDGGHPLAAGLLRLWAFNETGGARIADSLMRLPGTVQANTAWQVDGVGMGVKTHVTTPNGAILFGDQSGVLATRYSYHLVVTPTATGAQSILSNAETPGANVHDRDIYSNGSSQIVLSHYDGANKYAISTTTLQANVPVVICATYDGTSMRLYINGVLEATTTAGNPYTGYASPEITLGFGHNGVIDANRSTFIYHFLGVWSRALSPAEVQQLYVSPYAMFVQPRRRAVAIGSSGTAYTASLAGVLSSVGTPVRQTAKAALGGLTPAAILLRQMNKPSGGTLTSAGLPSRQVNKPSSGAVTSSGAAAKQTARKLTASLTPSGTVALIRAVLLSIAGTLTTAGIVVRQAGKGLVASIASSGTLPRHIDRRSTGGLTSDGAIARSSTLMRRGVLAPGGMLLSVLLGLVGSTPAARIFRVIRESRIFKVVAESRVFKA